MNLTVVTPKLTAAQRAEMSAGLAIAAARNQLSAESIEMARISADRCPVEAHGCYAAILRSYQFYEGVKP